MPTLIPKNKKWVLLGIFNLLYSICLVSLAYISKIIIDYAELGDKRKVIYVSLFFLGVILLGSLFKIIENVFYIKISINREKELKRLLFTKRIENKRFSDIHTGLLIQSYTTDINNVVSGEVDTYPRIFFELGRLSAAVISVFLINWRFLLILIGIGIIGLGAATIYSRVLKRLHKDVLENEGKLNSFFQESMENIKLIKSYNAANQFNSYYTNNEDKYIKSRAKMFHFQLVAGNILILGSNLIYAGCIFFGGYAIAMKLMKYGTLIAIIQLMGHIQSPIMSFSAIISRFSLYKASLSRLNERINIEEESLVDLDSFDSIKIDNLTFGYTDNLLFNNLSFEINKGDIIEIKGQSGIGKTSLFMILLGFLEPKSGSIRVEYKNKLYDNCNTRNLFSYVAQDNILFSGSIRDNFNLLVGDCNIEEALKFANLYDEIMELPNGIDTVLNERGSGLSIGQLQRVMLAIAYAKNRSIFLLDEFTSALDIENSNIIINNLIKANKTIIYISHKNEAITPNKIINMSDYININNIPRD